MKWKWVVVTVIFAGLSQYLNRYWVYAPMPGPSSTQLPFFIVLSLVESVAFGLGISFFLFGEHLLLRLKPKPNWLTWAVYLSIGWDLVSWWPHDNLHRVVGENLQGLLYIEYGFHVTLITTAVILAYWFLKTLKTK